MNIKKIWKKIIGEKNKEAGPKDFEWEDFKKQARDQFVKLKEKGLSIPVVTL